MSNSKTARVSDSSSPSSHASLKRVGTHNGSFHCDEALGCFMIRLTRKFFNAEIVRTRDPQVCMGPFSIQIQTQNV
ncbi:metal-dependent protein hydrolase [Trifolium pratense]|uniref:Metal-dependent protein hydrolase n=1 Tax=Trifolium pratense TaxID=57577 RepID=A0A2K3JNB9_TRIPR|nr:metal-dependent protein hydrolase [Trifolium pratense]